MLPKIIVSDEFDREILLKKLGLSIATVMVYEGKEGKIDSLRKFVNFGMNMSSGLEDTNLLIWDADSLSYECQAVLLKPLEDSSKNLSLMLIVRNENNLLPTVLSRCVVTVQAKNNRKKEEYWKNVLECFSKGPASCISFSDGLEKTEIENVLEEIINKLKFGLETSVNKNRLKVLKLAIECLANVRFTNANSKLAFSVFLINSWRLIN